MTRTNSIELFADSALALQGLSLSMGNREAILESVRSLMQAAAQVAEFRLPDEAEPASFFRA